MNANLKQVTLDKIYNNLIPVLIYLAHLQAFDKATLYNNIGIKVQYHNFGIKELYNIVW